jgi:hypothetical protein
MGMSATLLLVVAAIYGYVGWGSHGGMTAFYWGCCVANLGLFYDSIR